MMFKVQFLSFYLIIISISNLFAQGSWVNRYGNDTIAEYGKSVELIDGYIYVAGYTEQGPMGNSDFTFSKLDTIGNVIWTKYYGTTEIEVLSSMMYMHEGAFILVGEQFINFDQKNIFYLKTDFDGNIIWQKTHSVQDVRYSPSHLSHTNNHTEFLVAGMYNNGDGTGNNMFFARFDSVGNMIFEKVLQEALNDIAMNVHQNSNGEYLLIGDSNSFNGQGSSTSVLDYDIVVYKFNQDLDEVWYLVVGDTLSSGCQSSYIDENDNLYVVGETYIEGSYEYDIVIFKVDNAGNLIWEKKYGGVGREAAFDLVPSDNGFIITGYSNSNNPGTPTDAFILQTDWEGNGLTWEYYGFEGIDIPYSITKENNAIVVAGVSYSTNDSQIMVIYKPISELLNLQTPVIEKKYNVYPNPAKSQLFLNNFEKVEYINIFNNQGNKIDNSKYTYSSDNECIYIEKLPSGIYYIEVINLDKKQILKFVLE